MTRDEIIEMARQAWISDKEAQLITEFDEAYLSCTYLTDLTAFAKLVAAKEQEAIIDLVAFYGGPVDLEAAIRARSSSRGEA